MKFCINVNCHLMREHYPSECGWPAPMKPAHANHLPPALVSEAPREDVIEALHEVVAQVITDSDCCAICMNDITRHVEGCAIPIAIAALKASASRTPTTPTAGVTFGTTTVHGNAPAAPGTPFNGIPTTAVGGECVNKEI